MSELTNEVKRIAAEQNISLSEAKRVAIASRRTRENVIQRVAEKRFAALANQSLVTTFDVYSTRESVNVISRVGIHDACYGDSAGNHLFSRKRAAIRDYVKECVDDVRKQHGWDGDDFHSGAVFGSNGHYRVTLWRDK